MWWFALLADWTDIRQLPELVQTPGTISERMSLSELQSAAGVPVASTIRVRVASYTVDPSTNNNINNDWMPGPTTAFPFRLKPIPSMTTTPATTPTPRTPTAGSTTAKLKVVLQSAAGPARLFKV